MRNIPNYIKQQVRKECGFGCVICGFPIFEYDHIEEFSVVKEHKVENLTLLCPNHHLQKTKKIISKDFIKHKRLNPFNSGLEIISGLRFEANNVLNVVLGSNNFQTDTRFSNNYYCVWINGFSFFTIHFFEGWFTFSFALTDDVGNVILVVEQGELKFSKDIFDFEYISNVITITDKKENIIIRMQLSNYQIEITEGKMIDIRTLDGVKFIDGFLYELINNKPLGLNIGGTYRGGIGGICICNYDKFNDLIKPGGFGTARIIGAKKL